MNEIKDDPADKNKLKLRYESDDNGNLITVYNSDGELWLIYEYDDKGNHIAEYNADGSLKEAIYPYDVNNLDKIIGKMLEVPVADWEEEVSDDSEKLKSETYIDNGIRIRRVYNPNNGYLMHEYTYDQCNDQLLARYDYDTDGKLVAEYVYKYNSDGNLKAIYQYDVNDFHKIIGKIAFNS